MKVQINFCVLLLRWLQNHHKDWQHLWYSCGVCNDTHICFFGTNHDHDLEDPHISGYSLYPCRWFRGAALSELSAVQIGLRRISSFCFCCDSNDHHIRLKKVHRRKYYYEMNHKKSLQELKRTATNSDIY